VEKLGLSQAPLIEFSGRHNMLYENYIGYDFISLEVPNPERFVKHLGKAYIYLNKNILLFILEDAPFAEKILLQMSESGDFRGSGHLLNHFFEKLISEDSGKIDNIEQEISDLENSILDSKGRDYVKKIALLRRQLLLYKRYYEQLLNVLDELLENENELLTSTALRYFKIFDNKVDRRYHTIINLRDYVTQVREAYQAEVDIGLNNIMKIFTVLTAIFLPLTLLVGWYGMNLKMPEFTWNYAYPMVIGIAVLIVLFCLTYFKKNKWF